MKRVLTVVFAMMLIATSLFAAGVELTGVGIRSTNLGGNYRAVSNDWSGMFWNPAGLVWSKGLKAGASLEFVSPSVGYSALADNTPLSVTSTDEIKNEPKTFYIPAAGFYYSNEKMAYGIGFWAPFGLGAKWDLLNTSIYNNKYPKIDYEDDLQVISIQPTFAYKVSNNLSFGLGIALTLAEISIRKPGFTTPEKGEGVRVITESDLQGSGTGFSANIGFQWKPVENLALGASMRYYGTIGMDGTLSANTYMPAGGDVISMVPETDIKADLPLPMNLGVGFAYTGIKDLLITGDIALTQWSSWDVIDFTDTQGKPVKTIMGQEVDGLTLNWKDGIRIGLGLEYSLALADAKVRTAFYSEPAAAVVETMNPTIPDINRRNVIIFGFGIPIGPLEAGLMYEHMFIGDKTIDSWAVNKSDTGYENMAGTYTMNVHNFMIGLDYNF